MDKQKLEVTKFRVLRQDNPHLRSANGIITIVFKRNGLLSGFPFVTYAERTGSLFQLPIERPESDAR